MSSDVITHPTWNRMHVARRVRDIAKSMIRLSTLGRSIFPILASRLPGAEEPAIRLKVSEDVFDARPDLPTKPYPASSAMAGEMKEPPASGDGPQISADHIAAFLLARGSTGRADRDTAWLESHGYPATLINRVLDALRPALDRPRTRKELADRIAKTLGASSHRKSGRGWGAPRNAPGIQLGNVSLPLGYLIFLACYRGLACAGPPVKGNEATFVRPDVWLRNWRDLPVEEAEEELLRR